ncbi:uncharacterized protein LOC106867851 [Octopus bimaculoides]|nr:uncharacterized protein LOC106867851 [Octopus bimaculoides]
MTESMTESTTESTTESAIEPTTSTTMQKTEPGTLISRAATTERISQIFESATSSSIPSSIQPYPSSSIQPYPSSSIQPYTSSSASQITFPSSFPASPSSIGATSETKYTSFTTVEAITMTNGCICTCLTNSSTLKPNITDEQLDNKLREIISELTIPRRNTSKYIRSKKSMADERVSSKVIGGFTAIVVVAPFVLIVVVDLLPLLKWLYSYI